MSSHLWLGGSDQRLDLRIAVSEGRRGKRLGRRSPGLESPLAVLARLVALTACRNASAVEENARTEAPRPSEAMLISAM
jgi:hypothetical protein